MDEKDNVVAIVPDPDEATQAELDAQASQLAADVSLLRASLRDDNGEPATDEAAIRWATMTQAELLRRGAIVVEPARLEEWLVNAGCLALSQVTGRLHIARKVSPDSPDFAYYDTGEPYPDNETEH